MKKTGQLTYKDRVIIQDYLEREVPISFICKKLGVSKQTIYREINRNSKELKKRVVDSGIIDCKNRLTCPHVYDSQKKRYELCYKKCDNYKENSCDKILKFPFVCNKCEKKGKCRFNGRIYDAQSADEKANDLLSSSRKGLHISEEEFIYINDIISPLLIENKQSLSHILSSHPEINVEERTIRYWLDNGYMSARSHNLPKKVRFKVKKNYKSRVTKTSNIIENRTYSDFKK